MRRSSPTGARSCAGTALALLIAVPGVLLVFASPGYADSTTRDRLVNFIATLGPRVLIVGLPVIYALLRRTGIRAFAPLALVISLGANAGLQQPLNVAFQWGALTRSVSTASLDSFLHSDRFVPGATYRVLRGAGDGKLGLYHLLVAGGRLDSEMFPESMAMHSFPTVDAYGQLLCDAARRLRDRLHQLHRVAAHERAGAAGPHRRPAVTSRTCRARRTRPGPRRVPRQPVGVPSGPVAAPGGVRAATWAVNSWIARVSSRICFDMSRSSSFCFSSACTNSH